MRQQSSLRSQPMSQTEISRSSSCRREGGLQRQWTTWKRSSSVARRKNWNRRAWQDRMAQRRRSRSYAGKPRLDETTPALAGQAKNTRNATERVRRRKTPFLLAGKFRPMGDDTRWPFDFCLIQTARKKDAALAASLCLPINVLAVAAISTTAASSATAWAAISADTATRAASSAGTSTTMTSATSTASAISPAGRTVATRTIRTIWPACRYCFTVGVFAIEVRFAAFFLSEIATALKRDSFFTFAAWLSRRTLTTLTAFAAAGTLTRRPAAFAARTAAITFTALRRHFCALLAQNRLAAQLNAVPFNPQDFHQDLVAFLEFVFHFFYAMFRNFADM